MKAFLRNASSLHACKERCIVLSWLDTPRSAARIYDRSKPNEPTPSNIMPSLSLQFLNDAPEHIRCYASKTNLWIRNTYFDISTLAECDWQKSKQALEYHASISCYSKLIAQNYLFRVNVRATRPFPKTYTLGTVVTGALQEIKKMQQDSPPCEGVQLTWPDEQQNISRRRVVNKGSLLGALIWCCRNRNLLFLGDLSHLLSQELEEISLFHPVRLCIVCQLSQNISLAHGVSAQIGLCLFHCSEVLRRNNPAMVPSPGSRAVPTSSLRLHMKLLTNQILRATSALTFSFSKIWCCDK